MPLPPKVKAGCGVIGVFSAGFFCGITSLFFLLVFLIPRSEGWKNDESKNFLLGHLSNKLKLTEEQKSTLRPGFNQYLDQRWQLRADYLKEDREMLEEYLSTVEPELTPEQIEQARVMKERWWKGKKQMVNQ